LRSIPSTPSPQKREGTKERRKCLSKLFIIKFRNSEFNYLVSNAPLYEKRGLGLISKFLYMGGKIKKKPKKKGKKKNT
jgi:hypothetical protein